MLTVGVPIQPEIISVSFSTDDADLWHRNYDKFNKIKINQSL